jgi:hypothetical protein
VFLGSRIKEVRKGSFLFSFFIFLGPSKETRGRDGKKQAMLSAVHSIINVEGLSREY